jgi:uncharacterized membrane-anchored protein
MQHVRIARLLVLLLVTCGLSLQANVVRAAPAAPSATADVDEETSPADSPANEVPKGFQAGPRTVDLGHDLELALPESHVYVEPWKAKEILEQAGNFHNDDVIGIVLPKADENWWVVVSYEDPGYVKDDEKIDAKELLESMQEGQDEVNKERVAKGFPALRLDGWSTPPAYDRGKHHLVWGLLVASDKGKSVNYSTRILGRRGYVALNLVTSPEEAESHRPQVSALLDATTFKQGARYQDFDSKIDKVAEFGLTGLILGGAGFAALKFAKVGFLAKAGKLLIGLLVAGKKLVVVALAGIAALFKKLLGRKGSEGEA